MIPACNYGFFDPTKGSQDPGYLFRAAPEHIMIACELQTLQQRLKRRVLPNYSDAIRNLPRAKLLALLVAIIVPGGMVVPLCYAAFAALRRARVQP
jgi:hypothetical protein